MYTNYSIDARVQREAETLAALPEYSVSVISLKEGALHETQMIRGVKVQEVDLAKYRGNNDVRYMLSYLKFVLLSFLECTKLLAKRSLDIVHIHNMPNFLIFSATIPLLLGKKVILDIHDTLVETYSAKFDGKRSKFLQRLFYILASLEETICCSLASKIICVNHIQRDALIKRGIPERKIVISMNLPDPKRFSIYEEREKRSAKEGFKLVYFGTISRRLGIDLVIHAIARLKGRIPGIQFIVLGDGEDRQEIIKLSVDLGINDAVLFSESYVPHDKILQILPRMDLVIVPNRKNQATELMLPVKMLEGIAMGLPVIVSRLRTVEYYFSDDQVYYFDADRVDSLTDTILNAYHNESETLNKARKAKEFFEEYGWEQHKFNLISVYNELLVN